MNLKITWKCRTRDCVNVPFACDFQNDIVHPSIEVVASIYNGLLNATAHFIFVCCGFQILWFFKNEMWINWTRVVTCGTYLLQLRLPLNRSCDVSQFLSQNWRCHSAIPRFPEFRRVSESNQCPMRYFAAKQAVLAFPRPFCHEQCPSFDKSNIRRMQQLQQPKDSLKHPLQQPNCCHSALWRL